MPSNSIEKKIERRAKALLQSKDVSSKKMEVVRSLMENNNLSGREKYSAIIDIIKYCPDKSVEKPGRERVDSAKPKIPLRTSTWAEKSRIAPTETSYYIDEIYRKYKKYKLFKKRYLIHVNNRLGIGIQKRLSPTKKLLKAIIEIVAFQEKILTRLPNILMDILSDEAIDDPTYFNYLRIFRRWIIETPIVKYNMYEIKWMDRSAFESELQSYVINFFSFMKLDVEIKEQILLLFENKLRMMDDLQKEEVNEEDSLILKGEKDKRNLKREKLIFEYITAMRGFLPSDIKSESVLSTHVKLKYNIDSFPEFLLILLETLVFQKDISLNEIISYYDIVTPKVDSMNWDYSIDYLVEVGKDSDSRRRKHLDRLKEEVIPYNELNSLLKLRMEGQRVISKAFENQWKIAGKKQKDFGHIYNEDFFTFLDECVNFFNNSFVPVLNGTMIYFEDMNRNNLEGNLFSPTYFINELNGFSNLLNEMHLFKSSNPSLIISRDEIMRILRREIQSMSHIERFVLLIGDLFYQIGEEMQKLYGLHRKWVLAGGVLNNPDIIKTPLDILEESEDEIDNGRPIPFYNYRIVGFQDNRILSQQFMGKSMLTDSLKGGVFIHIMAFSYQLAYECKSENIYSRLDERKEILRRLREISR